jgi:hypothetical protein
VAYSHTQAQNGETVAEMRMHGVQAWGFCLLLFDPQP